MRRNLFITGTDTGVGKTHVTAALLTELRRRGVRAAAFKPIACGKGGRHDAEIYAAIMDHEQPLDVINPIYLRHPLAPSVAAKLERKSIDLRKIFRTYQQLAGDYSVVLVEGAGGLLVPIRENYFVANLAKALKLPIVIVARLGLGTINHTLLTAHQANAHGLKIAGLVLNDTVGGRQGLAEKTNIRVLPKLCKVPLLGVMLHGKRGQTSAARKICDQLFSGS
ncbi:MAG TPA: dethiobiotin synthase [Verrucomicrobiae bacterium]|nr:dethiobiotin synthase [Verrucomicrobiae bacterium]